MNDISFDLLAADISSKASEGARWIRTGVGASLVQKGWMGSVLYHNEISIERSAASCRVQGLRKTCWRDALGSALTPLLPPAEAQKTRRQRHLNHVKGSAACLRGAMVVTK
jgi:hypothetical protein